MSRHWEVIIRNKDEFMRISDIGYKFTVDTSLLEPDTKDSALLLEFSKAINEVKRRMIMEGIEP